MNASPPAVSIRLLALVLPWEVRDDVLGDLVERYGRRVERDGLPRARMWWARETRRLILVAGRERLRDLFPRRRTDDPDSPKQRYNLMHELFQDARYALHGMMARPAQSAAMVITMVLGIGATTAVFNVVNGVLLSPSPYPDAEQLVLVYEVDARADIVRMDNPVAAANYGDWREMNQVFSGMAHYGLGSSRVGTDDGPERVETAWVAPTFFETVGIRPAQGRAFVETDGSPEAAPVVVLGYDYWERRFGGDPAALGQVIETSGGDAEIVGIMPPAFSFLDRKPDVYYPWVLSEQSLQNRRSHGLFIVARRRPRVTHAQAQADMDRVVAALTPMYPGFLDGWGANVVPIEDAVVASIRPALFMLLAVVGLLLLSATFNLANLLLMRGFAEQRGLAVRAALGAGRWRLIRMRLVEAGLLGAIGILIGIPVAAIGTRALINIAPTELPRAEQIGIDASVLAFAAVLTLVTCLVAGLVPALRSALGAKESSLTEAGRSLIGDRSQHRWHGAFTVGQLAFSAMLLVSAGLMMTTFKQLLRVETGYEPGGVATMKLGLPGDAYPGSEEQARLWNNLLPQIEALPEVRTAGVTNFLPLLDFEGTWSVQVVGKPDWREGEKRDYGWQAVSPGYFQAMGIDLLQGRGFTREDLAEGLPVVIVNDAFVQRFFEPGEDAVGQSLFVITTADSTVRRIVGVVESVRHEALDTDPVPSYFMPYTQASISGYWVGSMNVVLRTEAGADPLVALRSAVSTVTGVDRNILITNRTTMQGHVDDSIAKERLASVLLNLFAVIALTLAVVGIYGVMSFVVTERRGEIGLRLALGAQPGEEVRRFLTGAAKLVAIGIGLGLVGAVGFSRIQASLLFGVESLDPAVYLTVALGFASVALGTAWLSARRASRVDPMTVLREG